MKKFYKRLGVTISVLLAPLIYSGCGGGDVPFVEASSSVSTISGVVSDGPIANARVFIDENFNGVYDLGEHYDITDENGKYLINYILEPGTQYMLVAEGSSDLNSSDVQDHPGQTLDFVMFVSLNSNGRKNIDTPKGYNYTADVSPLSFRNYLQTLDTNLGGTLQSATDSNTSLIIKSNDTNETYLFDTYINNSKSEMRSRLKEVSGLASGTNSQNDLLSTKTEIGVDANTSLQFSSGSDTNQSLYGVNTTHPAIVGNLRVSTALTPVTSTQSSYSVYVTPYKTIVTIPNYAQLRDANMSVIYGRDITIKDANNTKVDINNTSLSSEIIDTLAFDNINTENMAYMYYDGTAWQDGNRDVNISTTMSGLDASSLQLRPFVLVKKNGMQQKQRINIGSLDLLHDVVAIIKGHYNDVSIENQSSKIFPATSVKNSVTLDVTTLQNGELWTVVPNNFIIDSVVLVSEELKQLQSSGASSVVVDIENGNGDLTTYINFITNTTLLDLLRTGSGVNDTKGLEGMIQSKIFYEVLPLNLDESKSDANVTTAKSILKTNVDSFLSKNNSFNSNNYTSLQWNDSNKASSFTIDTINKRLTLLTQSSAVQDSYTSTTEWSFISGKVLKKYSKNVTSGIYKGTSLVTSISYEYDGNITTANFTYTKNLSYLDANGYSSLEKGSYEGTALFTLDSAYLVDDVKAAKVSQKYTQTNVNSGTNILNALVTYSDTNLSLENAYFKFHTQSFGDIEGSAIVKMSDATYAKSYSIPTNSYSNDNTITTAIFKSPIAISQGDVLYFSNMEKFSDSFLKNRVLYQLISDDNGTTWQTKKMTFGTYSVSIGDGLSGTNATHYDYNVTSEGNILYNGIKVGVKNASDNLLEVCQGSNITSCLGSINSYNYLYLDQNRAKTDFTVKMLSGVWSGSISDTCNDTNGSISLLFFDSSQSWSAESYDKTRHYGTGLLIENDGLTLKNGTTIWSNAAISEDFSSIYGNWDSGTCSGSLSATKE